MGVVNTKSGVITNRDASPRVINNSPAAAGQMRGFVGTCETTNTDSINSVYRFGQVPSNAVMHSLRVYSDDIGSNTVADFGLYDTTENGAAVVDQDFFGSAVSLKDGVLAGTDVVHESGAYDAAEGEQPLWQALGLSADPKKNYDVCATLTVAADAAGTITCKGTYGI